LPPRVQMDAARTTWHFHQHFDGCGGAEAVYHLVWVWAKTSWSERVVGASPPEAAVIDYTLAFRRTALQLPCRGADSWQVPQELRQAVGCTCQSHQTGWPSALAKCGTTVVQPAFAFPISDFTNFQGTGTPGYKTPQLPVICELHTTRASHRLCVYHIYRRSIISTRDTF
jgi:hypothetical protein